MTRTKKKIEKQVDKGVEDTFPASDPFSVGETSKEPPAGTPVSRKPPLIDKALVRKLAEKKPRPDKP